ncbi:MAG TPA: hypothetical protein VF509_03385 [Sphingobium sp.]
MPVRHIIFVFGLLTAAMMSAPAQAKGFPIIYNPGNVRVETVAELPDAPEYSSPQGHVDLGWAYKDYSIYGMPLWSGEAEGFVLKAGGGYFTLTPGALERISAQTGHDYAAEYHFNPVAHLWGWLVIFGLIGFAVWRKQRRDAAAPSAATAPAADVAPAADHEEDRAGGFGPDVEARVMARFEAAAAGHAPQPTTAPRTPVTFGRKVSPPAG